MNASLPLTGKRILITRPRAQAAELCDQLAALGAVPIVFPTIEIAPLEDASLLDEAIRHLDQYHWIIFTSVNGVKAFWERLDLSGFQNLTGFPGKFAAIGPATAQALIANGVTVTLIPDEYIAESIVDKIGDVHGQRILLPRADIAREALAIELQQRGAIVDEVAVYRTLPAAPDPVGLIEFQRGVDVITFTSSSTVRNFVALVGRDSFPPSTLITCIGPITASTARELGLRVDIMATEYTMTGLVSALVEYFSTNQPESARNTLEACMQKTPALFESSLTPNQHSALNNRQSVRPRRLRLNPALRRMVRETTLAPDDFIYPLFVTHGQQVRTEITSMPGVYQWSIDQLAREAESIAKLGIPAVILFGLPAEKDPIGLENFSSDGIVQQATRAIKNAVPEMIVITDVCLCEYTDHGHCGILNSPLPLSSAGEEDGEWGHHPHLPEGYVLNDETLGVLAKVAVSHAEAGADIVAPSGMIDGMVAAIRSGLDSSGFEHIPILSYSTKYASGFYGPFREAAQGAPKFGDRKTHQMDPANAREALRETELDVAEGADMLMVKPALSYLDIIRQTREQYPQLPLVAYNVSGEYAMVKAAAQRGWIDEERVTLEILTSIKRAGADLIITYHAKDAAQWMK